LVVADLLGVPETEYQRFRQGFGLSQAPGAIGSESPTGGDLNPLSWLDDWFSHYIEDRRRQPRKDVLTDLALATYPDGSMPEVTAVVRSATFLFAAGQETTAKLLAMALKVKADFRLTRRSTTVGGVNVKAGTPVMLLNGAANRDPRRFECPEEFRVDRHNSRAHMAFGRGNHTCPGGPLARAEGSISLERILDRTRDIRLSEDHHGPPGERRFDYEPTWVLRGLRNLHLEFTPVEAGP